jgi:hypothetical protein
MVLDLLAPTYLQSTNKEGHVCSSTSKCRCSQCNTIVVAMKRLKSVEVWKLIYYDEF